MSDEIKSPSRRYYLGCGSLSLLIGIGTGIAILLLPYSTNETLGMVLFIMSVCFIVVGLYCIFSNKQLVADEMDIIQTENDSLNELDRFLSSLGEFDPDNVYYNIMDYFIAVEEDKGLIVMGSVKIENNEVQTYESWNTRILYPKDIRGVEIRENGRGILSSSEFKNTLGMAAIGGLLFGGAGAIVGAMSSKDKHKIYELSLQFAIDSLKEPNIGFDFLDAPLQQNSLEHKQVLKLATLWYGKVSVILNRYNNAK